MHNQTSSETVSDLTEKVMAKFGIKRSDLESPVLRSALYGVRDWLGPLGHRQDAQPDNINSAESAHEHRDGDAIGKAGDNRNQFRLSRNDALQLLNDSKELGRIGGTVDGLEVLSASLGLFGYAYIGGFWNYYPTTHSNAWKYPPHILSSYSIGWKFKYWQKGWGVIDPALWKALRQRETVQWRAEDFDDDAAELGQHAIAEGITEGVSFPVFRQGSEIGLITLTPSDNSVVSAVELFEHRHGLRAFMEAFHNLAFDGQRDKIRNSIRLTKREREVMSMIVSGLRNVDIASSLDLSERTVKKHQDNIISKFMLGGRHDIAPEAIAMGFTYLGGGTKSH